MVAITKRNAPWLSAANNYKGKEKEKGEYLKTLKIEAIGR